MNKHQDTNQLRKILVEKILSNISETKTKDDISELTQLVNHKPEIHSDIPLLQSATILDFLHRQIVNGNRDVLSPEIIQEGYVYILDKLM